MIVPYQMLPLQARVDLALMAMKGYPAFPKAPTLLEPHHQILSVISRTLVGGILLLSRKAVVVFYSPSWLSKCILMLLSVDKSLLLNHMNLSTNFTLVAAFKLNWFSTKIEELKTLLECNLLTIVNRPSSLPITPCKVSLSFFISQIKLARSSQFSSVLILTIYDWVTVTSH